MSAETAQHDPETNHAAQHADAHAPVEHAPTQPEHHETPQKELTLWQKIVWNVKNAVATIMGPSKYEYHGQNGHAVPHANGHNANGHDKHEAKITEAQPEKKETKVEESDLKGIELFLKKFKPELKHVLYPCCHIHGIDKAFPGSHVTYVDSDKFSIDVQKKAGHDAHLMSAMDFNPEHDPDLLVLFNPTLNKENVAKVAELVKPGKYVLCNDYHHTAEHMYENPDFEFVGILKKERQNKDAELFTENLEKYVKPKAPPTDDVIKPHRFTTGMDDYYFFRRKQPAAAGSTAGQALPKAA